MKCIRFLRLLLCLLIISIVTNKNIYAQKFTISGYVQDIHSGEKLYGANVYDKNTMLGTSTNEYGFFSLTLEEDSVCLTVSYIGYSGYIECFYLNKDISKYIEINPAIELTEFVVQDKKSDRLVRSTDMGLVELPMKQLGSLPVLFGEADVLKTIQLLPGVQSGTEGTSGIYVRGGGPDQNLFLLDGVPVYNVSHLFGMFSVFNPDALSAVKIIKGGFPAMYGGRLSSVVDVKMRSGNMREFSGQGAIGNVAAKITLEGPIVKDKTAFIFSARRTYIDALAYPVMKIVTYTDKGTDEIAGYHFTDANLKINHIFSDKDRLLLSFYVGNDVAKYTYKYKNDNIFFPQAIAKEKLKINWGNITSSLRWNHVFTNKLFANTTLVFSNYNFNNQVYSFDKDISYEGEEEIVTIREFDLRFNSGIQNFGGKIDFDFRPIPQHSLKFGLSYLYYTFKPGVQTTYYTENDNEGKTSIGDKNIPASEFFVYAEDNWDIAKFLKANIGIHYSNFYVNKKLYNSLQPRLSFRFLLNNSMSIKASYAEMSQYVHLLTNSSMSLPTDLWLPSTDSIMPQHSRQIAMSWNYNINNDWDITVEGFYKQMENLLEYKEGATFLTTSTGWTSKVTQGKGWAYGTELMLRKNYGNLSGWIGYTLSWANRQFEEINSGEVFPYKYDRRHDVSIVLSYKVTDRVDIGATWVYGTGNAVTFAVQNYPYVEIDYNDDIYSYGSKNGYRLPPYHRLDLSVNFHKPKKWGKRTWTIGLYNAYNRMNPFVIFAEPDIREITQVSLFPMIPSVSYSFKF